MITILFALLLIALYFYGTRTFNYWKKRSIKHETPFPLFGNNAKNYLLQRSFSMVVADIYWKYPNEKVVGFFRSTRPELVIRDPNIIKRILVTDFAHFHMRSHIPYKHGAIERELLMHGVFFVDGDLWRSLRQSMSPMFTTSKLKAMFPTILACTGRLQAYILAAISLDHQLDARNLLSKYLMGIISALCFGLDGDTFADKHSVVLSFGVSAFKTDIKHCIILALRDIFPGLLQHYSVFPGLEQLLRDLVLSILKARNHKHSGRNDFIDIMLEYQARGKIMGNSMEKIKSKRRGIFSMELTDELIIAQVFVFFVAGYETSSTATSFTLHQLAYHPSIQRKVQAEIDKVLDEHGNMLSYDAVNKMKYLECTFKEAMRMFAPFGFLARRCSQAYTIPELGVTIDEGVGVIIPLQALHNDPQYFDEPEQFRPERFLPDVVKETTKHVYLPFGDGPRACIGLRLAMMQSLAGLAAVLSRFSISPAPTTSRHPSLEPTFNVAQRFTSLPLMFHERHPSSVNES